MLDSVTDGPAAAAEGPPVLRMLHHAQEVATLASILHIQGAVGGCSHGWQHLACTWPVLPAKELAAVVWAEDVEACDGHLREGGGELCGTGWCQ
jgi:hypothetical protein